MATPAVFEIEEFLQPISEEAPAGEDIRADSTPGSLYYKAKDARTAARAAERGSLEEAPTPPQEWGTVLETGAEILQTKGKDLEVASWMIEALVRLYGFAGLRDGFRIAHGLVERFWDGLYPTPDEDGIATRVGPLTGLNGEGQDGALIQPIRAVPLTEGENVYAFWRWEQANEVDKITDAERKARRIEAGAISVEQFTNSVKATSGRHFVELLADLDEAREAFASLTVALDAAAGHDSPPSTKIRDALQAIAEGIRFFAADKLEAERLAAEAAAAAGEEYAGGDDEAAAEGEGGVLVRRRAGEYGDREQAFAELLKIAGFFRRNEPHSPIAYTLEELVRRGRLSLNELLAELIDDAEQRKRFLIASGIKPPADEAASGY